jgi:hypothetical protein
LLEILPEAFAVVKRQRRFKDNSEIRVTATAKTEFSGNKPYVLLMEIILFGKISGMLPKEITGT